VQKRFATKREQKDTFSRWWFECPRSKTGFRLVGKVYELRFSQRHDYPSRAEGIFVPVVLISGTQNIELTASIDTGASYCLFSREYARALNINTEAGNRSPRPITGAAKALDVTRQTLNNLVNGEAGVSPEMAIRLSKAFGSTPEGWLRLQMSHDLARLRDREIDVKRVRKAS
jgi:antitoxin HigA-1